MAFAKRMLVFVVFVLFSLQVLAQGVSESEVKTILAKVDKAIAERDIEAIASVLSDRVEVSGSIAIGKDVHPFKYAKAEYLKGLSDSWAQVTEYNYQRINEVIAVTGDQATVTADVQESMVLQGQAMSANSKEVVTLERVDGHALITRIVANTSM